MTVFIAEDYCYLCTYRLPEMIIMMMIIYAYLYDDKNDDVEDD